MNKGFARVWGIFFVPHAKFHFGVSRAQLRIPLKLDTESTPN
jgi:hypothetical protein